MLTFPHLGRSPIADDRLPIIAAAPLSVPLALFSVMGYDINPSFALAPLVAWAFATAIPDKLTVAFGLAATGGLVSVVAAHLIVPSGDPIRSLFGLVLFLIAPSFLFLGRWLAQQGVTIERLILWFAVFATVFLVPVVARLFIQDQPVRGAIGWQGFAVLNAEWLTLPVFSTFGVISLAYLIALQMILLAGALFIDIPKWLKVTFSVGLFCAAFMVLGSESRAAQLCAIWLAATAGIACFKFRSHRRAALLVVLAVVVSAGATLWRVPANEMRIVQSAETVFSRMTSSSSGASRNTEMEDLSTGRVVLVTEGVREVLASPWIGNGFSSYGRYSASEAEGHLADNSSTHVFYLTALWKGGVVFALPLFAFLAIAARRALRARPWKTPAGFFITSAILLAFGPMAITWDVLYVPSAGALAWFLLGCVGVKSLSSTDAIGGLASS